MSDQNIAQNVEVVVQKKQKRPRTKGGAKKSTLWTWNDVCLRYGRCVDPIIEDGGDRRGGMWQKDSVITSMLGSGGMLKASKGQALSDSAHGNVHLSSHEPTDLNEFIRPSGMVDESGAGTRLYATV